MSNDIVKLRNKKTGEIVRTDMTEPIDVFIVNSDGEGNVLSFCSVSELNENLEDYEPKEPLIKDEKIQEFLKIVDELKCSTKHLEERLKNLNETIAELCGEEEE